MKTNIWCKNIVDWNDKKIDNAINNHSHTDQVYALHMYIAFKIWLVEQPPMCALQFDMVK